MSKSRTVKAHSKPTHKLQTKMMHGNLYTRSEGEQLVLYIETYKGDEDIIKMATDKCKELGIELWKVCVIGSKPTSFNTSATWCDDVLYLDETMAEYFEGCFDSNGSRIDG